MVQAGTVAAWKNEDGGQSFYPFACYTAMIAAAEERLAAAEPGPVAWDDHLYAVVSSDYDHPFFLGAYATLERAVLAQGGKPDKWDIFVKLGTPAPVPADAEPETVAHEIFSPKPFLPKPVPADAGAVEAEEPLDRQVAGMIRKLDALRHAFDMKGANATTITRVINTLSTMARTAQPAGEGVTWPLDYTAPFTAGRCADDTVHLTDANGYHVAWFNTHTQVPLSDLDAQEQEAKGSLALAEMIASAMNSFGGSALSPSDKREE
jgi:hypothetical protein